MSARGLKAIVRRNNDEFWNQEDMAVADEIIASDYVRHMPNGRDIRGREGIRQEVAAFHKAFADLQFSLEDVIAEGDKVAARFTGRGTHKGEFTGIPPTGKVVQYGAIVICRIAKGKIVESWAQEDSLWMMQQLGMELKPTHERT